MLFLVSGTSRSGKTLIAKKILADNQIPYLSLDWLMMGFNDGIPEYGIHHLLWPNEIAEKMGPFLLGMIDSMLIDGMDYVIEGEAMLPQLVADLVEKHPDKIKAVFVGYTEINVKDKVALVKKHGNGENDWLTNKSFFGSDCSSNRLFGWGFEGIQQQLNAEISILRAGHADFQNV
jgi:hypothetical protein